MASEPKPERKQNLGRQKIEIKKVEEKSKRYVTFSKRKQGLFNKAIELSILSRAQIAVIVFSENEKLFSFGNPDPDSIVRRYLSGGSSSSNQPGSSCREQCSEAMLKQQYEAALNQLAGEQKRLEMVKERKAAETAGGGGFWWNQPIEDMALEDLEQFQVSMEELKHNLVVSAEMRLISSLSTLPLPPLLAPQPAVSYVSLLNGDVSEDQAWDWMYSGSSSIAPRVGFGQLISKAIN